MAFTEDGEMKLPRGAADGLRAESKSHPARLDGVSLALSAPKNACFGCICAGLFRPQVIFCLWATTGNVPMGILLASHGA